MIVYSTYNQIYCKIAMAFLGKTGNLSIAIE